MGGRSHYEGVKHYCYSLEKRLINYLYGWNRVCVHCSTTVIHGDVPEGALECWSSK